MAVGKQVHFGNHLLFRTIAGRLFAALPWHYDQEMKVVVYSASWCRDCREAKRFLDKHQIAYTEIDIENSPGAAEEVVRNVGKRAIPQFVLDGKWVQPYRPGQGFLHREMSELFGVS
jgi:mycoredoxin